MLTGTKKPNHVFLMQQGRLRSLFSENEVFAIMSSENTNTVASWETFHSKWGPTQFSDEAKLSVRREREKKNSHLEGTADPFLYLRTPPQFIYLADKESEKSAFQVCDTS